MSFVGQPYHKSNSIQIHLDSLNIVENMIQQHFKNFVANMFLVGLRENHLHCTISRRLKTEFLKHFENFFILLYTP